MAASKELILMIIVILFFFASANSHVVRNYQYSPEVDVKALEAFKSSITDDPFDALANWYVGNHVCNWTGVSCHPKKLRVIALNLYDKSLEGTITPHLGNMSFLGVLNLTYNGFSGAIPNELGRLRRLKFLLLNRNNSILSIPKALRACTALTVIDLSINNLTGSIPSDLGQLQKLRNLSLDTSRLAGKVPESLGNCSEMEILNIENNFISGIIPFQLGLLASLQELSLGGNQLSGEIPLSLLNCTTLVNLFLIDNRLSGEIPSEIGAKLSNLRFLTLEKNELNGTIPTSLGNCSQLSILSLSTNVLTGGTPRDFGKLRHLERLYLAQNRLVSADSTPIFGVLSNCTSLQKLSLRNNDLKGDLPGSIGQLSQTLFYLSMSANRFTGSIPQEMSNLTGLITLYLGHNLLSGSLPSALGGMSTLQLLGLAENNLEGNIPYQFSQLKALFQQRLSKNQFSGEIHQVFASLQQLRRLDLSYNKFSGNIPDSIGRCSSLELLDLSHNQLTGVMPLQVVSLHNLQFYINVSHNELTGRLPAELGGMQMVLAIDLSANNFSGSIPSQLVNSAELDYLNLSYNSLEGTIPTTIGQLADLQDMDFSFNKLSGPLPRSIEKLRKLRHLNMSYNNFTGEIPYSGAFRKLNFTSFLGNAALCGGWIELPLCKLKTKHHHDSKRRIVILATSVGLGLLSVSCLVLRVLICFRRRKSALSETAATRLGTMLGSRLRETKIVSEEEVNRATNGLSPDNLVGRGGHGSVYKGVLDDGTIVAVKVIHSATSRGAYKRLIKECRTLGRVRHRNLVRIVGVSSSLQVKSLVMEFMSQGSLDMHLHCSENNSKLGLKKRLSILKEVAHGMAYLHHHCSPAIVHGDLKPSNVLLDELMRAYVGDFGISRLMISAAAQDDSTAGLGDTSSTVIGSIGYIAPEYGIGGRLSLKGDVYSYGILLLETITGKRPTDPVFSQEGQSCSTLQSWVGDAFPDRLLEVIDRDLVEEITQTEEDEHESHDLSETRNAIKGNGIVVWLAEIGMMCSREAWQQRPTMRKVEASLEQLVAKIL